MAEEEELWYNRLSKVWSKISMSPFWPSPQDAILLFLTVLLFCYVWSHESRRKHLPKVPPGPFGIPLLGYLPFLGPLPHTTFSKLANKYGDIFSMYLGSEFVVVLNSYDIVKEAFLKQGEILSDRPLKNTFQIPTENHMGGISGKPRMMQRKFLDKYFKEQGMGTSTTEAQIMEEIQHFIKNLQKLAVGPQPISFIDSLGISVSNNTCVLVFGRRFDYNDKRFLKIKHNEDELTHLYNNVHYFFFAPLLAKLLQKTIGGKIRRMKEIGKEFGRFCKEIITEHRQKPNEFQSMDYITTFINEQVNVSNSDLASKENFFTDQYLIGNLHALYGGGSETVQLTVQWAIIYLLHHPEIQKRIHDELDKEIGRERLVSIKDRPKTPYLDAVIMEVERIASVIPINLPHSNNARATTLGGYHIPKGAYVLANLWHIHHDPQLWKEPEIFNPERFLTSSGKVVRPNHLIPFSIGRTSCPGETLAKMELYLYLASMLQQFSFHPANKDSLPTLKPKINGLTLVTPHYSVILKPR